jgi:hypothetical protein
VSDAGQPVSLLRGPLPNGVEVRLVVIEAGGARSFEPAEWRDGLVVVERGELQVGDTRFVAGDVLSFDGLTLRELSNPGSEPVLIAGASRRS